MATRFVGASRKAMLIAGLLSVASLAGAAIAARAFRREARALRPAQGPISPPADAQQLQLRDVALSTSDGVVHGWLLPSRNGAAIIFVHGAPSDRSGLLPEARALAAHGYGALLLDMPGHGESQGRATWGASARSAVSAAVQALLARDDVQRIGAYGFSMGSSIVISAAADEPRISAVALSGVFTNVRDQLDVEFSHWGWLSQRPARWAAAYAGLAMDELVPSARVAALAPRPVLMIAGQHDSLVPLAMTRDVFAAAHAPKELLVVPGAGHGDYARAMGEPYFDKLRAFFDDALLPKQSASRGP